MATKRKLDLGAGDVHVPAAGGRATKTPTKRAVKKPKAVAEAFRKRLRVHGYLAKGSELHIRHMGDGVEREVHPRIAIDEACLSDVDAGPVWNQVAKYGHFEGHSAGTFDLDERAFADMVRNYHEVDGGHVAFDFEHASEQDATQGSIPTDGAPAQGWVRDLKYDVRGLHALVEWLEPARTYIREKKYRFLSPAIRFNAKHPVSGKPIGARLTSIGITNRPFLRAMQPLAASDRLASSTTGAPVAEPVAANAAEKIVTMTLAYAPHEYMPKLKAAMALHPLATAQECMDACDRLSDHYATGGGAPVDGVDVPGYCKALRDALNAPMHMTVEEIFDAVQEMIQAAMDQHVAEMHPDAAPLDDNGEDPGLATQTSATDGGDHKDTTSMDNAITAKLADLEVSKTTLEKTLTAKDDEIKKLAASEAELSLALKDAKGALDLSNAELVQLRDEKAKRDEADLTARIEEAFETYKDKKNLTADDKDTMLIVLKASAEKFEKIYPKVEASKRHLMLSLAGGATNPSAPGGVRGGGPRTGAEANVVTMSTSELAKKLSDEQNITLEEAQRRVLRARASGHAA